ncbi:hypothetical protein Thermus71206_20810 [Thermus antranikianii]
MHPHPHPQPPPASSQAQDRHAGHTPEMFRDRFLVSLLLTLPVLYTSEEVRGLLGFPPWKGASWIPLLLGTLIYLYGGVVFLQGAIRELRGRRPGMMTLVALGISVAYVYSLSVELGPKVALLTEGKPFWWELATLVDVMLLGHFLEMKAILGAGEALKALAKLMPQTAHRLRDGRIEDVPTSALREGDLILIRPGEQVPADGVVVEGATSMNEAFLTGESRPVAKGVGDEVLAGALNREGAIQVRVTRTGTSTTLGQIMRLVEEAQASRSRFQDLGDRAAGWLFYLAVLGGSATFFLWLLADASLSFALERAVTVVVIACPHALGLAIPLVVVNATAMAAQRGILIRNREAFERATGLRYVALDKTGTLTEGRFEVRGVYAEGLEEERALALAAALEAFSEHPLAEAIREHAKAHLGPETPLPSPTGVQAVPGKGVEGYLDGRLYRVGRPEWAKELGLSPSPYLAQALGEIEARGGKRGSTHERNPPPRPFRSPRPPAPFGPGGDKALKGPGPHPCDGHRGRRGGGGNPGCRAGYRPLPRPGPAPGQGPDRAGAKVPRPHGLRGRRHQRCPCPPGGGPRGGHRGGHPRGHGIRRCGAGQKRPPGRGPPPPSDPGHP